MKKSFDNFESDKIAELERKIEYARLSIKNLQTIINNATTTLETLSTSIETLTTQISDISTEISNIPTPENIDNELDFVFNGTYFVDDDYDEVIAGNYTDPNAE